MELGGDQAGRGTVEAVGQPISDRERDRGILALRERYGRGELTLEQFSTRLDQAFAATTGQELSAAIGADIGPVAVSAAACLPLYESLRKQLSAGERVLWVGQPDPRFGFPAIKRLLLPLGVVFTVPMVVWVAMAVHVATQSDQVHPGAGAAPVFGALAVLVILVFFLVVVLSRLAFHPARRQGLYAITDRRALRVVRHRHSEDVTALELSAIPTVSMRTRRGGSGTVVFGAGAQLPPFQALELGGFGGVGPLAFIGIPDAAQVAELIRELRDRDRDRDRRQ